jgi:hypothetical protein
MIVAGALIALVVMAGSAVYRFWGEGSAEVSAEDLSRVLIVAAAPDENGDVVGQIVLIADVTEDPAALEAVSPALEVTIPGTTYSALGDAYPFGGGAGTAEALARAEGGEPLPYVAIDANALEAALEAAGPLSVTLPADMSVYDGDDLYTFEAGKQTLSAVELLAVLKGAPYLTMGERDKLDASLAEALAEALAASPGTLEGADTNLSPEAIVRLQGAL